MLSSNGLLSWQFKHEIYMKFLAIIFWPVEVKKKKSSEISCMDKDRLAKVSYRQALPKMVCVGVGFPLLILFTYL